ncbi:MAG: hypothetical protein PHW64_03295 [Sulfuricurvum sp.]|nr:hypothetical protein [Sulfuricurvum sp.]
MDNNVIYLSDASYDASMNEAGIGIKNLTTGVSSALFINAASVNEAEEFALLEAINHAWVNHHRNCVFVYDNIGIDTQSIGAFFKGMFDHIQFLWMKRDYLSSVDALASSVRQQYSKNTSPVKQILKRASIISDAELVCTLMPLTRGETYGFLCAISGAAPMMKPYSMDIKEVNEKIIALLMNAGSSQLNGHLKERFGNVQAYKHRLYDELLQSAEFHVGWFEEAAYECRNTMHAA